LYLAVTGLSIYAWKDWFKSLCSLILLMAIIEHEDMPKTMLGIQGLNMWNILFVAICLPWLAHRSREGLVWDMPRHVAVLLLLYLGVILIGVFRAVFDRSYIETYPLKNLISEELLNTIKWVLPALLLFDGCRTRKRVLMALACLLTMYALIAVQVARRLPPSSVFSVSSDLIDETRRACTDIGYGAVDMSTMLAGVSWGILATLPLISRKKYRWLGLAAAIMVLYGQALTGGRAGYLAWAVIGLTLCVFKWRKYLVLAPVALVLLPIVFPGAAARMLEGFGQTNVAGQATTDLNAVTSDRTVFWPHIVRKIYESPWHGYGRLAMARTGLRDQLEAEYPGINAPQPHNMYLESLLDNGVFGSLPMWLLWAVMVVCSARLFRNDNRLYSAVGGVALSLMLAQLVAGIGSQHFYPEESTLGMWAAVLLALRVQVEEKRAQMMSLSSATMYERPLVTSEQDAVPIYAHGTISS
jgi:O-antigen ligase